MLCLCRFLALDHQLAECCHVGARRGHHGVGISTASSDNPAVLFEPPRTNAYDVSADGQRFLVLLPTIESNSVPLNLVLHWTEGLEKER